jgi:hypothetical protein
MAMEMQRELGKKIFYPKDYHSVFLKNLIINGIDLRIRFEDFDPLNKSFITINQFRGIINSLKFSMTEGELG